MYAWKLERKMVTKTTVMNENGEGEACIHFVCVFIARLVFMQLRIASLFVRALWMYGLFQKSWKQLAISLANHWNDGKINKI